MQYQREDQESDAHLVERKKKFRERARRVGKQLARVGAETLLRAAFRRALDEQGVDLATLGRMACEGLEVIWDAFRQFLG